MSLFLWKKSYEIGFPEIDMQHRRLVGLINELSDAMMISQGYRAVPHVLEELVDYVQLHFTSEESLMHEMNYPGQVEHCAEHLDFTGKILGYKGRYARDHDVDASELLRFMCEWLKNHIVARDQEFGRYMRRVEMGLEE
jgi:hemerythrin-like metal-binding protein